MIRLLSKKSFERVEPVTIEEVRSWITTKDVIEFDIESEGFDWVNHKIITYQLGIGEYVVVVDAEDYPISLF